MGQPGLCAITDPILFISAVTGVSAPPRFDPIHERHICIASDSGKPPKKLALNTEFAYD